MPHLHHSRHHLRRTDEPLARSVYRLLDRQEALLYVGSSYDPHSRLQAHFRGSPFAPYVRYMTVQWFNEDAAANYWEQLAHLSERPVFCHPAGVSRRQIPAVMRSDEDRAAYLGSAVPISGNRASLVIGGSRNAPYDETHCPSYVPNGVAAKALRVAPGELRRLAKSGLLTPVFWSGDTPEWNLDTLRPRLHALLTQP